MRFSILHLFVSIGYAAVAFAAIIEPDSWWRHAATIAWLGVVAGLIGAAGRPSDRRAANFSRIALCGLLFYLLIAYVPRAVDARHSWNFLPHQWLANWRTNWVAWAILGEGPPEYWPIGESGFARKNRSILLAEVAHVEFVSALNVSLAFGILTGGIASIRPVTARIAAESRVG